MKDYLQFNDEDLAAFIKQHKGTIHTREFPSRCSTCRFISRFEARWRGDGWFEKIQEDLGIYPSKEYTIERINRKGDWEKINCKWVLLKQVKAFRNVNHNVYKTYNNGKPCYKFSIHINNTIIEKFFQTKEEAIEYRDKFLKEKGLL